jgi:hypothetical protein
MVVFVAIFVGYRNVDAIRIGVDWSLGAIDPRSLLRVLWSQPDILDNRAWQLFQSFWLTAGWMRFPAPAPWYLILLALCLTATIGCWRRFFSHRRPQVERRIAATALLFVAIQFLGVFGVYLAVGAGMQGRYLMPAVAPLFGLFAWGLVESARWVPVRPEVSATMIAAVLIGLDISAWSLVLVPAYLS